MIGIILTGANPYFLVWWATVGLALTTQAVELGLLAFALFSVVHWLCDLVWLEALSLASHKGTELLGGRVQRIVLCGLRSDARRLRRQVPRRRDPVGACPGALDSAIVGRTSVRLRISAKRLPRCLFRTKLWCRRLACPGSRDGCTTIPRSWSWTVTYDFSRSRLGYGGLGLCAATWASHINE